MSLAVKICGLTEILRVEQAVSLGAAYVGFIFYPPSARALHPGAAAALAQAAPDHVGKVGVFVDPTDAELDAVLACCPLDIVQLHGREPPERVADVALRTGLQVMKAFSIADADDVAGIAAYDDVADLYLFDAKPPRSGNVLPGGNGLTFDWRLLQGRRFRHPWFLAGGLTAENLAAAVTLVAPPIVDVSSGVERWPGVKDPEKLTAFMTEARRLDERSSPTLVG